MYKIHKAVIPVAGLGTRMLPASKSIPKCMLPLYDLPILHYIVAELKEAGINEIVIVKNANTDAIVHYFSLDDDITQKLKAQNKMHLIQPVEELMRGLTIRFIDQLEPKGLADALYAAHTEIDEPFCLALGDDLFAENATAELLENYKPEYRALIGAKAVDPAEAHLYGILTTQPTDNVCRRITGIVEKPQFPVENPLAICGRYVFDAQIFDSIAQLPNDGEKMLTDAIVNTQPAYAQTIEAYRFDTGNFKGYAEAFRYYAFLKEENQ